MSKASEETRKTLLGDALLRHFDAGSTIFNCDDDATSGYILLDGWIKIARTRPCGAISVLTLHAPGDTFGFSESIREVPRATTAQAATDCTVLSISAHAICRGMREDSGFGRAVLGHSFQQNDTLLQQIESLKTFSGTQRVARFLLNHARFLNGCHVVRLPFQKHIVAHYLGLTPESLSRSLAKLREFGVRKIPEGVEIANPRALESLVGDTVETRHLKTA